MSGPYKVVPNMIGSSFEVRGPGDFIKDCGYKVSAERTAAMMNLARQHAIAECVGVVEKWGSYFTGNGSLALATAVEMVGKDLRALLAIDSQETPNAD